MTPHSRSNSASLLLLGVNGPELTALEADRFRRLQPAGYILFSRNLTSPRQTRDLTDSLRDLSNDTPILAIDQEGGRVSRTSAFAPPTPSAQTLGQRGNMEKIAKAAELTAEMLRMLGLNLDLAPVLDLDHFPNAQNALRGRCWHRDPQRVIDFGGHWNRWLRKRGISSCAKHFPACGRAETDPHHDLPICLATWQELLREDILPYSALMPELDAIMLAHVMFPHLDSTHPASLSPEIVQRKLRDQLGFDHHLVLTDDLDMGAITRRYGRGEDAKQAILAGNDLALICHQTESADLAATAIASLPNNLLHDATLRVESFRHRKLSPPPRWSDAEWAKLVTASQTLSDEFPQTPPAASNSPVENY